MPGLKSLAGVVVAVLVLSTLVNLLMLSGPLFMLQVFDRVLASRSVETLLVLSAFVLLALALLGVLDACRSVILGRFGDYVERSISGRVMGASIGLSNRPAHQATAEPIADASVIRGFFATPGAAAMFDAPWVPVFIAVIWFLHPLLGAFALASAAVLLCFALASEFLTRRNIGGNANRAGRLADEIVTNAPTARTMGLLPALIRRWLARRSVESDTTLAMTSTLGILGAASKAIRLIVQSAVLAIGAYLVLVRELTPGQMIAASIILGRALAPVEVAIGSWRHFVQARRAWRRLCRLLRAAEQVSPGLELPRPKGVLSADKVTLLAGPNRKPLLAGISFTVLDGKTIGIVGPSGSGKTSLGQVLSGAWRADSGAVRLDGADLDQWSEDSFGRHVGYLPQRVDLYSGTVAENIARFSDAPLDAVIDAAQKAGIDDMVRSLPDGYKTEVGMCGVALSGGQRTRIGLARALFGAPRVVILDEPDASLDQPGQTSLLDCIDALKADGATVVLIAHRAAILSKCDLLLWLEGGKQLAFGTAETVRERLSATHAKPLRAVGARNAGSE